MMSLLLGRKVGHFISVWFIMCFMGGSKVERLITEEGGSVGWGRGKD